MSKEQSAATALYAAKQTSGDAAIFAIYSLIATLSGLLGFLVAYQPYNLTKVYVEPTNWQVAVGALTVLTTATAIFAASLAFKRARFVRNRRTLVVGALAVAAFGALAGWNVPSRIQALAPMTATLFALILCLALIVVFTLDVFMEKLAVRASSRDAESIRAALMETPREEERDAYYLLIRDDVRQALKERGFVNSLSGIDPRGLYVFFRRMFEYEGYRTAYIEFRAEFRDLSREIFERGVSEGDEYEITFSGLEVITPNNGSHQYEADFSSRQVFNFETILPELDRAIEAVRDRVKLVERPTRAGRRALVSA